MATEVHIDFAKYLTHNGEDIYKLVKTKTNKYYLTDVKTGRIIANTKREILAVIRRFGEQNGLQK